MALIGILLGSIGTDVNSGLARYTDMAFLQDGVGLISIALGCFGIAEIVKNLDARNTLTPFNGKIKLLPTWPEFKRIIPSALRGSVIGSVLGILPGGGRPSRSSPPMPPTSASASTAKRSAAARSRAWPARPRPTRPPRAPASSRSWPSAFPRTP